MASMTAINVTTNVMGVSGTYTWGAMTPQGEKEPARWRGPSLLQESTSRVAMCELSVKIHRNGSDTADRAVVSGFLPITCDKESCYPSAIGKVPFSFNLVLPDILSDTQRSEAVDLIVKTLNTSALRTAITSGAGFF